MCNIWLGLSYILGKIEVDVCVWVDVSKLVSMKKVYTTPTWDIQGQAPIECLANEMIQQTITGNKMCSVLHLKVFIRSGIALFKHEFLINLKLKQNQNEQFL